MDQLLLACHAQQLNLFVESFLKMVQKLLESTEPQLQILATLSVCDPTYIHSYNYSTNNTFYSLLSLQILKKILLHIIEDMTFLLVNSQQCVIVVLQVI